MTCTTNTLDLLTVTAGYRKPPFGGRSISSQHEATVDNGETSLDYSRIHSLFRLPHAARIRLINILIIRRSGKILHDEITVHAQMKRKQYCCFIEFCERHIPGTEDIRQVSWSTAGDARRTIIMGTKTRQSFLCAGSLTNLTDLSLWLTFNADGSNRWC